MSRTSSGSTTVGVENGSTRVEQLLELLRGGDSLVIVCHDDPDPDCLSSALCLQRLAEGEGVADVRVVHGGGISHRQNWAMIERLDLRVQQYDPALVEAADLVAFVDQSVPGQNNPVPEGTDLDVVVDHHPVDAVTGRYFDNRPSYGATATILTEYLRSLGIAPDERLATALLFGIRRETSEFMRRSTTLSEYSAAQFLHPFADVDLIQTLSESLFAPETLDAIADVIRNRDCRESYLVSSAGAIPHREVVPLAADYLLNLDGTHTTVVYGVTDGAVEVSARTQDAEIHAGRRLERAFRECGSAGGHRNMAGASVPLADLPGAESEWDLDLVEAAIEHRLFQAFQR